jgi:hypothetical protein
MYRQRVKLFGSPRGNPVMAAKRCYGPSANTILRMHIAQERCNVEGCNAQAKITRNTTGINKNRVCLDHISKV